MSASTRARVLELTRLLYQAQQLPELARVRELVGLLLAQVREELVEVSQDNFLKKQGEAVALKKLLAMMSTPQGVPEAKPRE